MNVTQLRPNTDVRAASDEAPEAHPLEAAFAQYQDELLGTLFYLVGNREDARDALQEAFIKCWRHREMSDQPGCRSRSLGSNARERERGESG